MNKTLLLLAVLAASALLWAGIAADRHVQAPASIFPAAQNVTAARLVSGSGEEGIPGSSAELDLQLHDANRLELARILYWLSQGTLQGGFNRSPLPSGGPHQLIMETVDGTRLTITNAIDRIAIPTGDSWISTGVSVPQTVNVQMNDKTARITAPDLKRWMEETLPKRMEESRQEPE
ncbi:MULTISPECIES: hypothetical protein [Paenibacillus]|uniref:hypothetical protein n=1 Tax=Paenibacillus TaxID=44249 RepID=UPI0022B9234C|nr:hypothetical protein [Paenibacillus caseinilyticus]MCZ8519244.1 hypothetical protein [Paenibacillus caseinilyticus]